MPYHHQGFRKTLTPDQKARRATHIEASDVYLTDLGLGETDLNQCAVLFLDLCNFTNISRTLQTPQIVGILQELFEFCGKMVYKHHGLIDKYPGDGIVAFFPRMYFTEEEDQTVEWALDCATEIDYWFYNTMRWSHDLPKPSHSLDLSIGIDAGWVEIAHVGSIFHSELILLGDVVNSASKCQQAASRREIVVGEDARKRSRPLYRNYFATGPALDIVFESSNAKYLSHRFNWEKYADESSWIDKDLP